MSRISKLSIMILLLFIASFIITCGGGGGGSTPTYYRDADGDGYGNIDDSVTESPQPDGYILDNTDCDDTDASINPGAQEIPDDRIDQDCNGLFLKTYYEDSDSDGFGNAGTTKIAESQPDGYVTDDTDCDDTDSLTYPHADEVPDDGIDQDCDGYDGHVYYADLDGDGFGDPDNIYIDSFLPSMCVTDNTDCDDTDETINPAMPEICGDEKDNNCDGRVDEFCSIRIPQDFDTIQAAIDAASHFSEVTVDDGAYVENINLRGKGITLRSVNGAESTVIDGGGAGTVVTFEFEKEVSTIDGFTITNGTGTDLYDEDDYFYGGGILCNISSPFIKNCIITSNSSLVAHSGIGAGIYCIESTMNIDNCSIINNSKIDYTSEGGGISCDNSTLTITNSTISGNITEGFGGGVYSNNGSALMITNSTISGNVTSVVGGGIYTNNVSALTITNSTISGNKENGIRCSGSELTITDCVISDNGMNGILGSPAITNCTIIRNGVSGISTRGDATIKNCIIKGNNNSGIWSSDYTRVFSNPLIIDCIISGNTASSGGGIYCSLCNLTVINSLISGNTASKGGGIKVEYDEYDGADLFIMNSTISGNQANSGGGLSCNVLGTNTIVNSIIWGNTSTSDDREISIYDESLINVTYSNIRGGWEGVGNIDADPLFVDDTNADPALRDYHLSRGSPCIDAGIDTYGIKNIVPTNDLDGDRRPNGKTALIDIGFDEYSLRVPAVYGTIQEAIDDAIDYETVMVAHGRYVENINFRGKAITVKPQLGRGDTIIDGGGAGRVVTFNSFETPYSILNGFIITNGLGGIYCDSSSPKITNCTIAGNSSDNNGGGVYCDNSSSPSITNCTISQNTASLSGGAIFCYDSSPVVLNSILWGDTDGTSDNEIHLYDDPEKPSSINISYSDIQGGWPGDYNLNDDPLFMDDTNTDIALRDYHLTKDSPCIDIGYSEGMTLQYDIDGDERPQGAGIDIGSDEYMAE